MAPTIHHTGEQPDWREAATLELTSKRDELLRNRAKAKRAIERMTVRLGEIDTELEDLSRGAKALGLQMDLAELPASEAMREPSEQKARRQGSAPQFKDVALEYLAQVYPEARRATEIQDHVQKVLRREFHWKTAGMTLYRLKEGRKVDRVGQQWFFVPESEREKRATEEEERVAKRLAEIAPEPTDELEDLLG